MSSPSAPVPVISASELRHQLRTPLNHIIGYSEILLEENPPAAAAARLNAIVAEANLMLDAVQQTAAGIQGTVPAGAVALLRERIAGGIERVRQTSRDLRLSMRPESHSDLARIEAAAASMIEIVPAGPAVLSPLPPPVPDTQPVTFTGPGRILVVDDNDLNRDMLSRQLEKQQHEVATAADGEAALAMLRKQRFDVVLLDLMMPGMDGFAVLNAVKGDPALAGVAVILISALDEMDSVVRSIEAGAEDYLFKPVNPTLLRARIKSTLDKLRADEALQRKQRLESIGLLASGVAHDFNNLLTSIIGHAQLLSQTVTSMEDREMADSILQAGERAAELTRQLLAYSGKSMLQMQPLDLAALIGETEKLMRASVPRKTRLNIQIGQAPPIVGDRNQLRQVLLNLILNAGEAIGSDRAGCVSIETGTETLQMTAHFDVTPDSIKPGRYSWVEVRDDGCGMDPVTSAKIFEPFFTTKFMGRGLGLAAVAGIVRSHKGLIRLQTTAGQGSVLRLYFPVHMEQPEAAEVGSSILVVDDEPVVRQIVRVALERRGLKVLLADSGEAALEIFRRQSNCIDVVLLDWKMPVMDGAETMIRLREIKAGVKVIVSSGFAQSEAEEQFRKSGITGYLQKPYRMSDLTSMIEKTVANSRSV